MQSFLRIQHVCKIMKKNKGKQQLLFHEGNKLITSVQKYMETFPGKKVKQVIKCINSSISKSRK